MTSERVLRTHADAEAEDMSQQAVGALAQPRVVVGQQQQVAGGRARAQLQTRALRGAARQAGGRRAHVSRRARAPRRRPRRALVCHVHKNI